MPSDPTGATRQPVVNALSFDLEDWFHLLDIEAVADSARWESFPSLVVDRTTWILDALAAAGTHATFFVVGWVADRYPEIVARIAAEGHELALHTYWHRPVDHLTPEELRDDLERNLAAIDGAAPGRHVIGFRAPSFSIRPGTEWALDVLLDLGLEYDASFYPGRRANGGYPCPQEPHRFTDTPSGRPIRALPMSVLRVGRLSLAFSGGGYLRLLPLALIRYGFRRFHRRGLPVVVYLHPRDFSSRGPDVPMSPYRRFKCNVGLSTTGRKFDALLAGYSFDTCARVLGLDATA